MKTRERFAAGGGGRQSAPAPNLHGPGGAERLPVAPRERKPALAALAVLLILVGALGATVMVMRAGNKVSVVEVTSPVAAGEKIPSSAIREVMVSDNTGLSFIRWNQRGDLTSHFRAATNLTQGSVLVRSMITDQDNSVPAGKSLVGISLKEGQFPTGLRTGQTVAAYFVGDTTKTSSGASGDSAGSGSTLISDTLVLRSIGTNSSDVGTSDTSVTVIADDSVVSALTTAASSQDVALVSVPSKN